MYTTVNPTNLAVIMGGAAQCGFQGGWTGNVPSYDFRLLDSPVAPIIDAAYTQPGYNVAWGTDVPGMAALYRRDAGGPSRPPALRRIRYRLDSKHRSPKQCCLQRPKAAT